jgi:ribosomal protein S18 acetylase RimI-like enzyme
VDGVRVVPITDTDREWARAFVAEHWGGDLMVSRGRRFYPGENPGFLAVAGDGERVGLLTYELLGDECEVTSLDSLRPGLGIGTRLLNAAIDAARQAGCRRLFLITTNDNLDALALYQKRGLRLCALYPNAMEETRRLKPAIPEIGYHGIPLRDELELELLL